jgi:tol-pal system protein YbgF
MPVICGGKVDAIMRNENLRVLGIAFVGLVITSAPIVANAAWWAPGVKATPAVSATHPLLPVQFSEGVPERFNRIEAQMRTLTGQVEELTHELRQLQDQLKRMQEDNEFRFRDLESGGSAGVRSEAPAQAVEPESSAPPQSPVPTLPPPGQPDAIGAIAGEAPIPPQVPPDVGGPGAPPQPLGPLTIDAPPSGSSNQPIDLTQPLPPGGPEVAMIAPTGDPRTDYDRAYGSILSGDYDTAELALRQFLAAYPDNALAPDAQYWLGESLFVRAQYRDAANEFLAGYKAYPKSAKAPDALLKLGLSLAGLGEREAACRTFDAVLKQYPDASNALRQRVKFEQSSASC